MSELLSDQRTDIGAADRWAALNAVAQAMDESSELVAALENLLDRTLQEVLGLDAGWLMLRDEARTVSRTVAWRGVPLEALANWQAVDVQAKRGHLAAQMDAPLLSGDLSPYPELGLLAAEGWRCYVGIPLLAHNRPQGLLAALGRDSCPFGAGDRDFLMAVGQQIGAAIESARLRIALEQSERRYQTVTEFSSDALLLIDEKLRITFANQRAAELTDYARDGLVGMDIRWLLPAEFHDRIATMHDHRLAGDVSSAHCDELTLITKTGERREVEVTFARVGEEYPGQALTCVYVHDVTEIKRAERLLRPLNGAVLAMQRAATSQDVFAAMGHKLSEAGIKVLVATLDEDGRHLTLNHFALGPEDQIKLEQLLGRSPVGERFPLDAVPALQKTISSAQARFVNGFEVTVGLPPQAAEIFSREHGICAPLFIGNQVHGVFAVAAPFLTEADMQAVTGFVHQMATALENVQHYQAATRRAQELATLNEIGRAVASTLDLEGLLTHTMEGVNQILNVEAGSVLLVDEETGDLVFRVSLQHDEWQAISNLRVPAGTGIVGAVVEKGKPIIVPDTAQDPRFYPNVDDEMEFVTRSILCVPLIARGQTIGAIEVLNKIGGQFTNEDLELLSSVAASVGVAIENAALYKAEQTHAEVLEARVAERTRDLNLAIEELFEKERAQREVSDQLLKANREIEAIINSVADGLIVTDEFGRMRMTNPRADELLGCQLEELKGKRITTDEGACSVLSLLARTIQPMESTTVELEVPRLQQTRQTNCWENLQCTCEDCPAWGHAELQCWLVPGTRCAGTHLPASSEPADVRCAGCERYQKLEKLTLQAHSAPILGEDRQVMGTVTVLRDITRLRELDRLKSKFVSNVSHELRTPLTNIKMYVSLLQKGKPEKQARYLEIIERESNRLTMLIEDILSLSRLEARETPPQRVPVAVGETVESVLSIHQARAEIKAIDLKAQLAPSLPLIEADRNQIVQMLTNLVGNALNYTPEGGTVRVSTFQVEVARGTAHVVRGAEGAEDIPALLLSGVRSGNWVAIRVTDTGIGIPAEDRERIFDRFYRGKVEDLGIPGTGLGLPIVREILELHNGHVFVESEEGVGSTFTVLLPVPVATPTGKPVVLVADDDPMVGEVVGRFLSAAEFEVELVHDGLEAMNRVTSLKPALLVLDLSMPGMDGYEVLGQLRSDPATRDLPVLVLSGWEEARAERAMTLGANEFLTKPFSGKVLADVVRRLLNLD
jgi:NtrC-family two-component system sensor histidine kinase KinB